MTGIVSSLMGLVFGFALQKGMVHLPSVIRSQFLFGQNRMLAMFLSAAGTSAVVVQLLKLAYGRGPAMDEYSARSTRGPLAVFVGGLVLGFGMQVSASPLALFLFLFDFLSFQLSGSCPGTVWVQAGALVPNFALVWLGGLLAAYSFSLLYSRIENRFVVLVVLGIVLLSIFSFESGFFSLGRSWLAARSELPALSNTSGFVLAAFFFVVVAAANYLDVTISASSSSSSSSFSLGLLSRASWHPAAAGVLVGALELPAALVWNELIGSSQS